MTAVRNSMKEHIDNLKRQLSVKTTTKDLWATNKTVNTALFIKVMTLLEKMETISMAVMTGNWIVKQLPTGNDTNSL